MPTQLVKTLRNLALVTGLAVLMTMASASTSEPDAMDLERGVFRGCFEGMDFSTKGREFHILLAEVAARKAERDDRGRTLVLQYDLTVLREFRRSVAGGMKVSVLSRVRLSGSGPAVIPLDWKAGDLVVILVATTDEPNKFLYAGLTKLIGLDVPCQVKRPDVAMIEAAMAKLREVAVTADGMMDAKDAARLLDQRENYYLWALGAAAVAARNDGAAEHSLYERWMASGPLRLAPKQIVWLDWCYDHYFAEAVGRSREERHGMLLEYLSRIDPVTPTGNPAAATQPAR